MAQLFAADRYRLCAKREDGYSNRLRTRLYARYIRLDVQQSCGRCLPLDRESEHHRKLVLLPGISADHRTAARRVSDNSLERHAPAGERDWSVLYPRQPEDSIC